MNIGWIKLHREFINWEWYSDINVRVLFIHLLITVNYEDKKWKGRLVKKGSRITGRKQLSSETGLTERNIRTAIKKLQSTNDLTIQLSNSGSMFTVVNWCKYQSIDHQNDHQNDHVPTNERPRTDHVPTTTKEDNNIINKEINNILLEKETKELFKTWLDYRKEIKKIIKSDQTKISLAKKIQSKGFEESKKVINFSIENGYQGLFWDKKQNSNKKEQPFYANR